ncbi:hypothetical protein [Neptuniibacter sp. QD37_11]|uniref:hypothetical protein n=1 Tax=Neptuniibacter sp. QD37_11 TaxID=3398209 RepID=UPI0039F63764
MSTTDSVFAPLRAGDCLLIGDAINIELLKAGPTPEFKMAVGDGVFADKLNQRSRLALACNTAHRGVHRLPPNEIIQLTEQDCVWVSQCSGESVSLRCVSDKDVYLQK